jgi:hypothetical protein
MDAAGFRGGRVRGPLLLVAEAVRTEIGELVARAQAVA